MSIIGEMYEEQIWENRAELKKRMEEYLSELEQKSHGMDFGTFAAYQTSIKLFKEKFENELRG